MKKLLPILLFLFILASCQGTATPVVVVPTLVVLPSLTATSTPTLTPTPSDTPTGTLTPATATQTPSDTSTVSATPTSTETPTLTVTASVTITDTPTPTASDTPTVTASVGVLGALAVLASQATILPPEIRYGPTLTAMAAAGPTAPPLTNYCASPPLGGLGSVFASDATLTQQLGCPIGQPPIVSQVPTAVQTYQNGEMIWVQGPPNYIYALNSNGTFHRYDDTFVAGVDPESGGETPPVGLIEPVRGFGKVWRNTPEVRNGLGWALNPEQGGTASVQLFDRGRAFYLPQRPETVLLIDDPGGLSGTWRSVNASF